MSYESVNKIKSLQQHIETFTGKSYGDLTAAVQELKNGYGGEEDYNEGYEAGKLDGYSEGYTASQNARQEKTFVENGEYTPDDGCSGFSKVTVNVTDVDTVDGWHVAVRNDGSAPPSGTFNTISFVYTGG